LFTPYRDGEYPVQIHYSNDEGGCQLRLSEACGDAARRLLHGLRELLQAENVVV
jgi:hypothetical protein